jgi:flavin reductase (DIM6/NTAB) family NADH-FMN oxidoreductase RutF
MFRGKLKTAHMITECPVNLGYKLDNVIDNDQREMFIGDIGSTYTEEKYLTSGTIDLQKIKPFLVSPILQPERYYTMSEPKGEAYNVGKNFKTKQKRATK